MNNLKTEWINRLDDLINKLYDIQYNQTVINELLGMLQEHTLDKDDYNVSFDRLNVLASVLNDYTEQIQKKIDTVDNDIVSLRYAIVHTIQALYSVITREVNFGTGESAITHYERLAAGKEYSLAELHLETGRTHQIRVHMKYIGHPLPGDYLYNPDYRRINRQPLHSYQLEFTHPITGKVMLFTAPLPIDFISAFYSNSLK